GSYTLGALLPGKYAPSVKELVLTAGERRTEDIALAAEAVQVQYPLNYSHDWISGADAPGDYTFGDTAFIAEQLPIQAGKTQHGTVVFTMGDISEGGQNMIFVNSQFLPVPEGNYSALYLLESCVSGFYTRNWTLTFTDGTTETIPVQFSDWCGGASKVEQEWKRTVNRHNPSGETGPNCAIFYQAQFISNFTKKLRSITLNADPSGYATNSGGLFALTLEAAAAPATGTITGTVRGPAGPVAGAWVVVGYDPSVHSQGSGWAVGPTDSSGRFSGAAPAGTWPVTVVARGTGLKGMTKSVSITAGQTLDMGTITLESYGTQVVSWLRSTDVNQGLRHIEPKEVPDAATQAYVSTVVNIGGREARQANNFAFDVDDNFLFRGQPTSEVYIRIRYYDEGTDTIYVDFTNSDLALGAGKYETAQEIVTRGDTKTWKTADVGLDAAGFYGTQEMAGDFRIRGTNLILDYVVVSTTSQIRDPGEPPAPPVTIVYGDLNGDGKVGIPDVTIALRIAVGAQTGTPDQVKAGDLNANGRIEIAEVTKILRFAVGLIKELP
ncbi:MAG: dockerin type I domain-containing protein, partial [Armatimonadota bacterium]